MIKLIFPATVRMAEFILDNNILRASVDSKLNSLEAELQDDEIILAVSKYNAHVYPGKNYLPD